MASHLTHGSREVTPRPVTHQTHHLASPLMVKEEEMLTTLLVNKERCGGCLLLHLHLLCPGISKPEGSPRANDPKEMQD